MIQTIINEPLILTSNSSLIVFDATSIRTRCAYCCNGGWLDYENGNPIFKVFGNNYNGYYNASYSFTISSATPGVIAVGLYEDGILIPDTVRAVTIDAAGDFETISFDRSIKICPRGDSSIVLASVPFVLDPLEVGVSVETEIPIIVAGSFKLSRKND